MEQLMEQDEIHYIWCGHYPYVKTHYDKSYITAIKKLTERIFNGNEDGHKPYNLPRSLHSSVNSRSMSDENVTIIYNADNNN